MRIMYTLNLKNIRHLLHRKSTITTLLPYCAFKLNIILLDSKREIALDNSKSKLVLFNK